MKRSTNSGFALIVVLFMVAIITILFVGYIVTMRTERMAAAAMAGNERAKIIAQDALEHATALLENNIPEPIPPGTVGVPENWIISPGLLTKYAGPDGSAATFIPLSTSTSTLPTSLPSSFTSDYVNLNAQQLSSSGGTPAYPIIPTGEPLPMNWAYVLKDPTAAASATNPIVGRYAFWMDDENARININTAYGKPSTINLNRANPLDQSTAVSTDDTAGTAGDFGSFDANVGFNSLEPTNWLTSTTGYYPAFSNADADGHIYNSNYPPLYSNAIGNSTSHEGTGSVQLRYYPLWHPSAVNIDILPMSLSSSTCVGATENGGSLDRRSMADWVFNKEYLTSNTFMQDWRLMQDPAQIKEFVTSFSPGPDNFYQANKFNLTAYNRAPEFNVFGKPRLLLEDSIQSKATYTTKPTTSNDPMFSQTAIINNNCGAELQFYITPDLDPLGPMFFHGDDQMNSGSGSTWQYGDLSSVQMVGDYFSTILNRTDWPGMPSGDSFVTKWGGTSSDSAGPIVASDDPGRREADQVAWNIVAMGNYSADRENTQNAGGWPDDWYPTVMRTLGMGGVDNAGDVSPTWPGLLSDQTPSPPNSDYDPNRFLRVGKLSGKAIMPYTPKPYVNEVALIVEAFPVNGSASNGIYLKLHLEVELYVGRRGPPASFWTQHWVPAFELTHFFYTVTDGTNTATQAADGAFSSPDSGNDGGNTGSYTDAYNGVLADHYTNAGDKHRAPFINYLGGLAATSGTSVVNVPIGDFFTITTTRGTNTASGNAIYVCSGTTSLISEGTSTSTPPSAAVMFKSTATNVRVQAHARLALYGNSNSTPVWEIVPVWDQVDTSLGALKPPKLQGTPLPGPSGAPISGDSLSWDFNIDLTQVTNLNTVTNPATYTRSLEIKDSRLGGNIFDVSGNPLWVQNSAAATVANPNPPGDASPDDLSTLGTYNSNAANGTTPDDSYGYDDFQNRFYPNSPRPSIGFLGCLPTGQQRGIAGNAPGGTFYFGPSGNTNNLPDWLILDLVAPSFYDHAQDTPAPYSYLNSTMGKININAVLNPVIVNTSSVTLQRWLPLEAVFQNMNTADTITSASATAPATSIVSNIIKHNLSSNLTNHGVAWGAMNASPPQYDYIGELCEVAGVADGTNTPGGTGGTNWQKAALIRNLANLFTTQSNTFHIWGAAQAIQVIKGNGNTNYGAYQAGDIVTVIGEKRFESVVERAVWPGVDGVPGNGHVNASGAYDRMANSSAAPIPNLYPWAALPIPLTSPVSPTPTWAQMDGPDDPTSLRSSAGYTPTPGWFTLSWTHTSLINANNPIRAHMAYKPIVFRYLTE